MSYANVYGIEVYRLALRETVNEGGSEDESGENTVPSGEISEKAPESAKTEQEPSAMAMEKKNRAPTTGEEEQEVGDVVRLDPIASLKKSKDASGSSQRVVLVTRPSQR